MLKERKKLYVLDTNVIISSPHCIYAFDENDVAITEVTLDELDKLKNSSGEKGVNAREFLRILDSFQKQGPLFNDFSLNNGIKLNDLGSYFFIITGNSYLNSNLCLGNNDDKIIKICNSLQESLPKTWYEKVVLVTNDICMRIKASRYSLEAQKYLSDDTKDYKEQYQGKSIVYVNKGVLDNYFKRNNDSDKNNLTNYIFVDDIVEFERKNQTKLYPNEFVIIKDIENPAHSALGMFDGEKIVHLNYENTRPAGIKPMNSSQKFALEALLTSVDKIPLAILKGPAGTAKTFLALAAGIEGLNRGDYHRILVARPNIKFDEDIGYLKGSEEEKIDPLIRPIKDNLENISLCNHQDLTQLFQEDKLRAEALAYMRGRSIDNTYIIIDEAQNLTPVQAFGIVSRAGKNAKVVLIGDPQQIDNPRLSTSCNGLSYTSENMKGSVLCSQFTFSEKDCFRSDLAQEAINKLTPKGFDVV